LEVDTNVSEKHSASIIRIEASWKWDRCRHIGGACSLYIQDQIFQEVDANVSMEYAAYFFMVEVSWRWILRITTFCWNILPLSSG
jgi:hypothetical protein